MVATLEERLQQIRDNPKLQSQQQTHLVLSAVEDTLRDQKADLTPTAYFSALLALLSQYISTKSIVNKEVATAVVYLLDLFTPHVPQSLLRAKFAQILSKLAVVLTQSEAEAPILRPSIGCLESLLIVQDSQGWALPQSQISPRRAVAGLLNIASDHRPKVRLRAQEALTRVLKNPPPSPSLDHPAADMCAETALRVLKEGVVASKKQKKSHSHKDAQAHAPSLIHTLQLIKIIAKASGGWPSRKIDALCELLLDISRSSNEFLTKESFAVFEVIFEGMADEVSSAKLPSLLDSLESLQPSETDTQLMPPWVAVLSRGYDVSAQVLPEDTFQKLPAVFEKVAHFLGSMSYPVRTSAADCLISFLVNCIPISAIVEPSIYDEKLLEKLAKAGIQLLSVKYQSAWEDVFRVIAAMLEAFHWRSETLLVDAVKTVAELRSNPGFNGKEQADAVISKAIGSMGPQRVLEILPLNLATRTSEPGRVWLLPLMRDSIGNTNLAHFRSELVPLSEKLYTKILEHGEAEKTVEIKIYETIVQQIWSTLPGYCDFPLDLVDAFDQPFAEQISNVLYQQVELRTDLCRALQILIDSNTDRLAMLEDESLALLRVSKADAEKNLEHMKGFASNILAILFNVYTETLPQYRGPIIQCINSYLSITSENDLIETFGRVVTMLEGSLSETNGQAKGKSNGEPANSRMPPLNQTLMDLVIAMAGHLPRASLAQLFSVAMVILQKNDSFLQKKAYKMIPRLAESEVGRQALQERSAELQDLLLKTSENVATHARRDRLRSISQLIDHLPATDLHFIPAILPEVVLCTKESNTKAREAAYDLLISMGEKMSEGGTIVQSKVPHLPEGAPTVTASLDEYFTMVSAGLAGSTPLSISATILAVSRILFHFQDKLADNTVGEIIETMDIFLESQNREIVRSVLGFVKVCAARLPPKLLEPRLASLIPHLLKWNQEHKARFQSKIRHILERMIRRIGLPAVEKATPESDRKFITSIRKEVARRKKKRTTDANASDSDDAAPRRAKHKLDGAVDEALYGSDDDAASSASDSSDDEILGKTRKRRAPEDKFIVEADDEPLDLLDKRALAHISSTRPLKARGAPKKHKATVNADGKLVFAADASAQADSEMADADAGAPADGGVDAYVAALKGGNAARRGQKGRIKFSNKPGREAGDEDEEMEEASLGKEVQAARKQKNGKDVSSSKGGSPGKGMAMGKKLVKGGAMKAQKAQRRGLGVEKTRGGRVTKASSSRVGRG
ncbi:ribosomal RNA-processing protein 12 [Microthyrium microscopicum]|uniref:Ribosomal RNA-processing protein 12 n=1 Tax=Microthyrium microscopicum TaxID=703497 RepID=A0A6A6U3N6_9PEZI|nr:ribosomal RNA-processing protein 12 [Microthyrium microscopicum]